MKIWIDMTAPAHVLVFRPIIPRLRERGHEVEVTARDYAQTLELLELHGIEHTAFGRHGGASRLSKLRSLLSRSRATRRFARKREIEPAALAEAAHGPRPGHELAELAQSRRAAVMAECLVLHAVQLEQVERLRVVTRRHLDLVPGRAQPRDDRPEHEHVRRRGHVDPDFH